MANYKGYFSDLNCRKYVVNIIADFNSNEYQEILLGKTPITVSYNTSRTPFEPVRTSTATINIVNDNYLHDALSSCAQGTKIELRDITQTTAGTIVWVGYLTPKVYDASYDSCWEEFSLEAADCISSLQYVDYKELSGGGVTSIKKIIDKICDATESLDGYYWAISKKIGSSILTPNLLSISEHNFQTNDTEEYWKMDEVLREICRYLGFTCLQWGSYMYFLDYQYLEPSNHNAFATYKYNKAGNYTKVGTASNPQMLASAYTVTADSYMSKGATISMEPIYNKVVVNANMYAMDDFIPNPFDDEFITNRIDSGNTYASVEIPPFRNGTSQDNPYCQWYPNGGVMGITQAWAMEKESDDKYIYYMRPFDHKYWESVYTDISTGSAATPTESELKSSAITKDWRGGTLVDLGVVRKDHKSETNPAQWIIPSKMDYTRYLCISERHTNDHTGNRSDDRGARQVVYRLKDGYKSRGVLDDKCFLVLNCSCIFERYEDCNYINPEWTDAQQKKRGTEAGSWHDSIPRPSFRINIGDKGWSSSEGQWVAAGSASDLCRPQMKWDENKYTYWNKSIEILNNVSWRDKVNAEGIKIPLSGVDTSQVIKFEIVNPDPTFYGNTGNPNFVHKWYNMNAYCWISDLSISVVREGESDLGNDSDVIYENELSGCSVNDMDEIRVKITTLTDAVKPSYSHMLRGTSAFLETVLEESLGNSTAQKPEENIIQKYVHQYSTPTKKITLPLPIGITPFQKLFGVDVENLGDAYVQLGTELDYKYARQTITAVQKTKQ